MFGSVISEMKQRVGGLDPRLITTAEAVKLLGELDTVERLAHAGKTLLAARASESGEWRRQGARGPAEWLALTTGTSGGAAKALLETSERLAELPATEDALRQGELSGPQAEVVAAAGAADPKSEKAMLLRAKHTPLPELRRESDRIRAAACPDPDARYRRIHASRYLRFGSDAEGAGTGSWKVTPDVQAELKSLLKPFMDEMFRRARVEGRREPSEAYAVDALVAMAQAAYRGAAATAPEPTAPEPTEQPPDTESDAEPDARTFPMPSATAAKRHSPATVIVRIDHDALLRGCTQAGETCDIAGVGPVPVSVVNEWIASGDVFLAAVVTKGVDVATVAHLGRRPNAYQLSALRWRDPICRNERCGLPVSEIDHHIDWADSHQTCLSHLGGLCEHCHDLKSYKGYRIVASEIPGKIRLIPPEDDPDPPPI